MEILVLLYIIGAAVTAATAEISVDNSNVFTVMLICTAMIALWPLFWIVLLTFGKKS